MASNCICRRIVSTPENSILYTCCSQNVDIIYTRGDENIITFITNLARGSFLLDEGDFIDTREGTLYLTADAFSDVGVISIYTLRD